MEVGDRVLVGLVRESSRKNYLKKFEEGVADLYYTGPLFPTSISLHDLHYFIPYFKGKGIRDVYEITRVVTKEHGNTLKRSFRIKGMDMDNQSACSLVGV